MQWDSWVLQYRSNSWPEGHTSTFSTSILAPSNSHWSKANICLCIAIEEGLLPDFKLAFPIRHISLLHRPSKSHLREVFALIELVGNVDSMTSWSDSTSRDAIRNDPTIFCCRSRARKASFDGVATIVDDESLGRCCGRRGLDGGRHGLFFVQVLFGGGSYTGRKWCQS